MNVTVEFFLFNTESNGSHDELAHHLTAVTKALDLIAFGEASVARL